MKQFDYAVANPMWNQDNYDETFYEADAEKWNRFKYGTPPKSSADWGWVQHILASLNNQGRAAIVLDTGAVSRGRVVSRRIRRRRFGRNALKKT